MIKNIKQDCDFNILIISENQKFKYELTYNINNQCNLIKSNNIYNSMDNAIIAARKYINEICVKNELTPKQIAFNIKK